MKRTTVKSFSSLLFAMSAFLFLSGAIEHELPEHIPAVRVIKYYDNIDPSTFPLYFGDGKTPDACNYEKTYDSFRLSKFEIESSAVVKKTDVFLGKDAGRGFLGKSWDIGFVTLDGNLFSKSKFYLIHFQEDNFLWFCRLDENGIYFIEEHDTVKSDKLRDKYGVSRSDNSRWSSLETAKNIEDVIAYFREVLKLKYYSYDPDKPDISSLTKEQYEFVQKTATHQLRARQEQLKKKQRLLEAEQRKKRAEMERQGEMLETARYKAVRLTEERGQEILDIAWPLALGGLTYKQTDFVDSQTTESGYEVKTKIRYLNLVNFEHYLELTFFYNAQAEETGIKLSDYSDIIGPAKISPTRLLRKIKEY